MNTYLVKSIYWDLTGRQTSRPQRELTCSNNGLFQAVLVQCDSPDDIADAISNCTGFCIFNFRSKLVN